MIKEIEMPLTKSITVGTPKHVMGDQYSIPITFRVMNGIAEELTIDIDIDYKDGQTLASAFTKGVIKEKIQTAVNAYKTAKKIASKTALMEQAVNALLETIELGD
jgi:hypothetical protein